MTNNRKQQKQGKKIAKQVKKVVQRDLRLNKPRNKRNRGPKTTTVGRALRELGGAAGGMFGMPAIGRSLGAGISRVFGQGDYSISAPQSNSLMTGGVPAFSPMSSGFRIKHREYIQDIQSSTAFALTAFNINPGLPTTFPWLSSVAQNFEEYKIHGMIFYLNSLSATAVSSTNTALGLWGAVTVYDPTEPVFTTKQQCENYVGCQTSVPSCSVVHGIECKPNINVMDRFYVRQGTINDSEDLKFYDVGQTFIFTQGSQAVANIGELWVSYDIEFLKPKLPTNQNNFVATDRYIIGTTTDAVPLGASSTPVAGSSLLSSVNSAGTICTIPANAPNTNYYAVVRWLTGATAFGQPTITFGGSLTGKAWFENNTLNQIPAPANTALTTRKAMIFAFVKVSPTVGTITFSGGSGTAGSADFFITQAYSGLAERPVVNKLGFDEVSWLKAFILQQRAKKTPLSIKSTPFEEHKGDADTEDSPSYEELEILTKKVMETPTRGRITKKLEFPLHK